MVVAVPVYVAVVSSGNEVFLFMARGCIAGHAPIIWTDKLELTSRLQTADNYSYLSTLVSDTSSLP